MLRRRAALLCAAPLLLWAALASAGTSGSPGPNQLYGHISSNRTLTFASPGPNYEIIGDLTIDPGVTLTIERGVTVRATANADYLATGLYRGRVEVTVEGTLVVPPGAGTVVLASNAGGPNGWYGIRVLAGGTLLLSDCFIYHTMIAARAETNGVLHMSRVTVHETHNGVALAPGAVAVLKGCSLNGFGMAESVGLETGISVADPDSLSPAPTTVIGFQLGIRTLLPVTLTRLYVVNCNQALDVANGTTLTYCTLRNCSFRFRTEALAFFYNSVISGDIALFDPYYGYGSVDQYYAYTDCVANSSVLDPFYGGMTGTQVSSFEPYFDPDGSLNPASYFTNFSVSGGEIGAFGPGPVGPTPILAASVVDAVGTGGFAKIRWFSEARGSSKAGIFRRIEDSDWQPLTVLYPDGQGYVTLEDRDVTPGTRYGYGVGVQRDSHVGIEGEVWVTVEEQVSGLSLASIEPNPASTSWGVAFMSPETADSQVEVIDLGGRVVHTVGLGPMSVGRQSVSVNAQGLSPGVYWIRIRQGSRSVLAKAVKTN